MSQSPIISIRNLTKRIGTTPILCDVSLDINDGEVVAITGNSGAGKSTLLKCLMHLTSADSGTIIVGGQQLCRDGTYARGRERRQIITSMGMVFQNFNLFPNMTVLRNLELPLRLARTHTRDQVRTRAQQLLQRVGLADRANAMPSTLSGGERQRAALARALMLEPSIMLFDEPTSSLDPLLTQEVLAVIRSLTDQHITMMIVTHEIEFAMQVASRIVYMNNGQIVESGTPDQMVNAPTNPLTAAFFRFQSANNSTE